MQDKTLGLILAGVGIIVIAGIFIYNRGDKKDKVVDANFDDINMSDLDMRTILSQMDEREMGHAQS